MFKLNFDDKEIEIKFLEISAKRKNAINMLERDHAIKVSQESQKILEDGRHKSLLTSTESVTMTSMTNMVYGSYEFTPEVLLKKEELIEQCKPIWQKIEDYVIESLKIELAVAKIQLLIDDRNLTTEHKEMIQSSIDSDFWQNQSYVNLEEINNFFRGYSK